MDQAVKAFRDAFANNTSYVELFDELIAASKRATGAERDAAVAALLAPGFDNAEITGILCVASGALVEDGASTAIGFDTILDRMADGAEILANADLEDAHLDADTPPPMSLPIAERRWVAGWKSHVRGAMARLARDVSARKRLRAHERLVTAVRALAEKTYANHLHYIASVIDMLDDEPIHVIDLCNGGTITRYRAFGIRNGFHLMTVLDGYDPFAFAATGARFVQAKHAWYSWFALSQTESGFAATDLMALLWGEPPAAGLPRFEGVRTIIKAPPAMARSWDAHFIAPIHETLREQLIVEHQLGVDEARPVLARIAAAAAQR